MKEEIKSFIKHINLSFIFLLIFFMMMSIGILAGVNSVRYDYSNDYGTFITDSWNNCTDYIFFWDRILTIIIFIILLIPITLGFFIGWLIPLPFLIWESIIILFMLWLIIKMIWIICIFIKNTFNDNDKKPIKERKKFIYLLKKIFKSNFLDYKRGKNK